MEDFGAFLNFAKGPLAEGEPGVIISAPFCEAQQFERTFGFVISDGHVMRQANGTLSAVSAAAGGV